jgi:pyruvate, water dikinase
MDLLKTLGLRRRSLPPLDERIACFREVLEANNTALGLIAKIQELLAGDAPPSSAEVRRVVAGVAVKTYRMVTHLNRMTGDRYRDVERRFQTLKGEIARRVEVAQVLQPTGLVVPLLEVGPPQAEVVGQKSAYLGEAGRLLGAHVPAGLATTVEAYRAFMAEGDLGARLAREVDALATSDVAGCFGASSRAVQLVENAPVPAAVAEALDAAVARLPDRCQRLAVRSSALQEGGLEMSFAGQYRSLLNVPREHVVDAFRRVVASKYSPQALTYRLRRGYEDREVEMCCCLLEMVDAEAAGVLYTRFSTSAGPRTLLQAVRGLGLSSVDGSAEPDTFILQPGKRSVEVKRGVQRSLLRCAEGEGTERVLLDPGADVDADPGAGGRGSGWRAAITEGQALEVAALAWRLETALGMPLDVEWAIDRRGQVFVLQVRPLSDLPSRSEASCKLRVPTAQVLLDQGARASGGAAAGRVWNVRSDRDILSFPDRAVAVVSEANPRFAALLPRACAIVADLGEVTGHLATVARELHVPAFFATRAATRLLVDGTEVTVDADAEVVYAGRVEEALVAAVPGPAPARRSPGHALLAGAAPLITPLTLRDRQASGYSAKRCRTLHDLIRFCHQATIEAIFDLGDAALRDAARSPRKLVSPVPIDCRVLDLGGGLREGAGAAGEVTAEDLACRPMRELWRGMTDPRLRWQQQRPVSLRGFMSALVNYNFDDDARMRRMGEPSYAFITADYLNLNSRIGYHFSTVDARIGETVESNYVSFRFVGGSTGIDQRSRRALLIQRLLAARGFDTDCLADLVNTRLRRRPAPEMDEALFLVGLVIGFVNHLDMALVSDEAVAVHEREFLSGNYGFKGGAEGGTGDA